MNDSDVDIFSDLTLDEKDFELPNGKKLKLVALDIYQRMDIQQELKELAESKSDNANIMPIYKKVVKLCALNDNYESFLTNVQLNKLARIESGRLIIAMFNQVMDLSGAGQKQRKAAKKKPETHK